MNAVKCGKAHGYHASVADVRKCYNGDDVPLVDVGRTSGGADGATVRQVSYLKDLLRMHAVRPVKPLDAFAKSEASELISFLRPAPEIGSRDKTRFGLVNGYVCDTPKCAAAATFKVVHGLNAQIPTYHCDHHAGLGGPETSVTRLPGDGASLAPNAPANHTDPKARDGYVQVPGLNDVWVPANPAPAFDSENLEDGFYVLNGVVYKVVVAVHGSGRKYAKRLDADGTWNRAPGLVRQLRPEHKMTLAQALEVAKRYATDMSGELYGRCFVCGRTLTDEDSIAASIGPVCAAKFA